MNFSGLSDPQGHSVTYGGMFDAETLMQPLEELRMAYEHDINDPVLVAVLDEAAL